jgi:mannose-6-phosphate isomerase
LKQGVTRQEFEHKIQQGTVAECFHRVPVKAGDAMFLPSGRVHAIGAGLVIFEIQQNSDTTYRVFDWNRLGLDNQPRPLHVPESLASIDFADFEPPLVDAKPSATSYGHVRVLIQDPLFAVEVHQAAPKLLVTLKPLTMQILAVLSGELVVRGGEMDCSLSAGEFCLVPASLNQVGVLSAMPTTFLTIEAGKS